MNPSRPELSSIELHAVLTELQPLVSAKIDQLYHLGGKEFLFQLHQPGQGKRLLRVLPGKLLYLTSQKPLAAEPTEFCLQLRRRLANATITRIEQPGAQRIIRIMLQKETTLQLIIELFSKGNMLLCDSSQQIIAILERQRWQSRELRVGIPYALPPDVPNIFRMQQQELAGLLSTSAKDTLVTALATGCSLGGLYAEELCARANIDKSTAPSSLTPDHHASLWAAWQQLIAQLAAPKGYVWPTGIITPTPLAAQLPQREFPSFSEALDSILSTTKVQQQQLAVEQRYQQKIRQLRTIIEKQQETAAKLEAQAAEEARKGDALYEHYQQVRKLLEGIEAARADGGWDAARELLAKDKAVTAVDLKNKKVAVELG